MTKKEFAIFAAALRTYYPREKLLPNEQAMSLWFRQLEDIPYNLAEAVLNRWVATNKWSPSIADIREQAASVMHGEAPDWSEAWESVLQAVREYGSYDPEGAMAGLDTLTQEVVRRIGYRHICMADNLGVERANFRRMYELITERKKKEAQIPPQLAQKLEALRIGGGTDAGHQIGEILQ